MSMLIEDDAAEVDDPEMNVHPNEAGPMLRRQTSDDLLTNLSVVDGQGYVDGSLFSRANTRSAQPTIPSNHPFHATSRRLTQCDELDQLLQRSVRRIRHYIC